MKTTLKALLFIIVLIGCFYFAIQRAFHAEFDPDLFWHIGHGRQLMTDFHLPIRDASSIHREGQEVKAAPWMFDYAVAQIDKKFGVIGLQTFKASIFIISIFLLCSLYFLKVDLLALSCGLILLTFGLNSKFVLRPDTVAIPLFLASTIICFLLIQNWSMGLFVVWLVLLTFWVNFHGSAIFGLILGLCLAFSISLKAVKNPSLRARAAYVALSILVVSMLGYHMPNPFLSVFGVSPYLKLIITEYQPLNFFALDAATMAALLGGAIALPLALMSGNYGIALAVFIFLVSGFAMVRMLSVFFIFSSIATTWELSLFLKSKILNRQKLYLKYFGFIFLAGLFTLPVLSLYLLSKNPMALEFRKSSFPIEFSSELSKLPSGTHIFNDYYLGGFLIYTSPQSRVWIDGRTPILHSEEDFRQFTLLTNSPDLLSQKVDKEKIDIVISKVKLDSNMLTQTALLTGRFAVRWLSPVYIGLVKAPPYFLSTTVLMYNPECFWKLKKSDVDADLIELNLVNEDSTVLIRENLLLLQKIVGRKFTNKEILDLAQTSNPINLRVLALLAAENKAYDLASYILTPIASKSPWDFLQFAQWQLLLNRPQVANQSLAQVPDVSYFSRQQIETLFRIHHASIDNARDDFPTARMESFKRVYDNPGKYNPVWNDPNCIGWLHSLREKQKKRAL